MLKSDAARVLSPSNVEREVRLSTWFPKAVKGGPYTLSSTQGVWDFPTTPAFVLGCELGYWWTRWVYNDARIIHLYS